ncbi:MAG: pyrroline-5-carboxylate reductase [Euryarchaeota archaeon]|nr:pyrroline-5-carboxylate reductase [Euryarchaeota archaeon]MDE1836389.1 pyrroline-5-carboxylate reductase [Euryarchaeota archaeon]MDE1879600.1 pyrroline-5-carboxylate reductase [Euryarchaeota archaeon]MDE2044137.1 pyrroline-5-carboxylate reductase [Thermoplasmata archaeon]
MTGHAVRGLSPARPPGPKRGDRASSPPFAEGTLAILGGGNMGLALVRGILTVAPEIAPHLVVSSREAGSLRERIRGLDVRVAETNLEAVKGAQLVVLAVKPQILPSVLAQVKDALAPGTTVVSIAAGVPTTVLEEGLGPGIGVVRAMPNVAASVQASATAIARGKTTRPVDLERARSLLSTVGMVVEVDEELMDAVTGLSGTGPLYLFLILEGLSDAGVKVGLSRATSTELAIQTLVGAAQLVRATGEHPAKLRDLVTSPGGTAITALHSLEKSGLKAMLLDAVEAATKRSQELGAKWRPRPPGELPGH